MFELRVLNGLHEGATLPLSGEAWQLGNTTERDLQLCDDSISSLHAMLERHDDHWQLIPKEGDVALQEGPISDALNLNLNQPFQLSGVWLVVAESSEPWESTSLIPAVSETPQAETKRRFSTKVPRWFQPAVTVFCVIWAVALVGWFFTPTEKATVQTDNRPVIKDSESLRAILLKKLGDRGLTKQVTISGNNHVMRLNGALTQDQLGIVSRMVQQIKSNYSLRLPLDNATHLLKLSLPFRIVQITAGAHANIVTENGRRLFIGDQEDGFTLAHITKDQVQFTGPSSISVRW